MCCFYVIDGSVEERTHCEEKRKCHAFAYQCTMLVAGSSDEFGVVLIFEEQKIYVLQETVSFDIF